jgi:uncharacterized protein (UPF0276 family)
MVMRFAGAPPASLMNEPEWVAAITAAADTPLLLDLHNLDANAVNFGHEPLAYLIRFPLQQVAIVHISGVRIDGPAAPGEPPIARLLVRRGVQTFDPIGPERQFPAALRSNC